MGDTEAVRRPPRHERPILAACDLDPRSGGPIRRRRAGIEALLLRKKVEVVRVVCHQKNYDACVLVIAFVLRAASTLRLIRGFDSDEKWVRVLGRLME